MLFVPQPGGEKPGPISCSRRSGIPQWPPRAAISTTPAYLQVRMRWRVRPPHRAQAPPCSAKRIRSGAKSLIYKGGGACARPAVLSHAAGANEHCIGFARVGQAQRSRREPLPIFTPKAAGTKPFGCRAPRTIRRMAGAWRSPTGMPAYNPGRAMIVRFMPSFRENTPRDNEARSKRNSLRRAILDRKVRKIRSNS